MRWTISAVLAAGFILAGFAMAGTASADPVGKVLMCHFDVNQTGPNAGPHTIEVAPSAVEARLRQGDTIGACNGGTADVCPEGTVGTFPDCVTPAFCVVNPTAPACLDGGNGGNGGNGGTPGGGPGVFGGSDPNPANFPRVGGFVTPPAPVAQVAGVQQVQQVQPVQPARLPAAGFGPGESNGFGISWSAALAVTLLSLGGMTALMARRQES